MKSYGHKPFTHKGSQRPVAVRIRAHFSPPPPSPLGLWPPQLCKGKSLMTTTTCGHWQQLEVLCAALEIYLTIQNMDAFGH